MRKVVFGVNNLISDAPISRLDLLLCRNVFIYLDANLLKRVLTRFHYALGPRRPGARHSELIPLAAKAFEPIDLGRRVYRKDRRRAPTVAQERLLGLVEPESAARAEELPADVSVAESFYRDVLQSVKVPLVATGIDNRRDRRCSGSAPGRRLLFSTTRRSSRGTSTSTARPYATSPAIASTGRQ